MNRWIKKIEKVFVSVAFTEMNEHDDPGKILGIKHVDPKELLDDIFVSVTFA